MANQTASTGTTRRKRTPAKLSEFGKAVHHHLIDSGMTMPEIVKASGMKDSAFRKILAGKEKPPRHWIRNTKLAKFLRHAAADAHRGEIEFDYLALQELTSPTEAQAPETPETPETLFA